MRRPTRALWAAALASGLVAGQDPPKQDPAKKDSARAAAQDPASEALAAARKEKQELQKATGEKFRAAKTPAEQQKIRAEFMEGMHKIDLDFARKFPKHPAVFDILTNLGTKESRDLLLQHYSGDKRLGEACLRLSGEGDPEVSAFIRTVRDQAKAPETKAVATLALANSLKTQADNAEDDKAIARLQAEAEKLFEEVARDHADVKVGPSTVGAFAKKNLFELRHLAVGKPAPDIDGKDVDDKPMKLSDYKGKVILLDFWAHW